MRIITILLTTSILTVAAEHYAVPPLPKQAVPKPIPYKVPPKLKYNTPPLVSTAQNKTSKKSKTKHYKKKHRVTKTSPVRSHKVLKKHKIPTGLTIHKTKKHNVKPILHSNKKRIPKQHHGEKPVLLQHKIKKHHVLDPVKKKKIGKTLYPKKPKTKKNLHTKTVPQHHISRTIEKPSASQTVQTITIGSKKPLHDKSKQSYIPSIEQHDDHNKHGEHHNEHHGDHKDHHNEHNEHNEHHNKHEEHHYNNYNYDRYTPSIQVSKTVPQPLKVPKSTKGKKIISSKQIKTQTTKTTQQKIQTAQLHKIRQKQKQTIKQQQQIKQQQNLATKAKNKQTALKQAQKSKTHQQALKHQKQTNAAVNQHKINTSIKKQIKSQKTHNTVKKQHKTDTTKLHNNKIKSPSINKIKTPPIPVPTQQIPQPVPTMYNNPTATGMKPTIMQKTPGIQNMKPGAQVTNNQGQVIGIVQKGANGQKYLAPATKGQVPGAVPTIGQVPTKMQVPSKSSKGVNVPPTAKQIKTNATAKQNNKTKLNTYHPSVKKPPVTTKLVNTSTKQVQVHTKNNQHFTSVKVPNSNGKGTQTIYIPVKVKGNTVKYNKQPVNQVQTHASKNWSTVITNPHAKQGQTVGYIQNNQGQIVGTLHKNTLNNVVYTFTPGSVKNPAKQTGQVAAHLQPPKKGGNAQPMVQPKPSVQGTPMVHPKPSAPNTVNGVKQTTPMVHPTPSKPGTVNGVKQIAPTLFPKPVGGNAKPVAHPSPVTQAVPTVKPGTVVHNKQGHPIGTVVTLPNGKQAIKPIASPGAIPQTVPNKVPQSVPHATPMAQPGAVPTPTPIAQPGLMPSKTTGQTPAAVQQSRPTIQAPAGTVLTGKNGQPIGTVVKLPNGQKGIKPIVAPKPSVQGTPHLNPVKLKAPPAKGGNAQPMVQPKPSVQGTPMVHPKPSAPNTVNGVKQTTPMVHPTPSKPGTVNGVKQVAPTLFPKPVGGNAKPVAHPSPVTQAVPTVKPGTVVHNSKGQPIGTVVNLPNGKQGIQPIAVPGTTSQKPAGLKNPNQKPTVKLGTVVHNSKGQPIGTVVKLPNGQTAVQPIAAPGVTPQIKPIHIPTKATGQVPATLQNPNAKPSIHSPVGTVVKGKNGQPIGTVIKLPNGQKAIQPIAIPGATPQVKPTVQPKPVGGNAKPVLRPTPVTQAIPTVKQGTTVHNQHGRPIGTVTTLPNGKQVLKPIATPGAIPQKPAKLKNPNQIPTIKPGTIIHNNQGQPIGTVVKLPNGQITLQPIATPSATPQANPNKVPQAVPHATHAAVPGVVPQAKPYPVPTIPQKVPGLQQMKPGSTVKNKQGQVIGTVQKGSNSKNVIAPIAVPHPTPTAQPGKVPIPTPMAQPGMTPNKVPQAVPHATPMAQPGAVPTPTPIAQPGLMPSKTTGQTPAAVQQSRPTIQVPAGTVLTGKNGQPIGTGQTGTNTKIHKITSKNEKPGFFDRILNYFRGDQEKIIEPGIRNKEVETYRTHDKKEMQYKDTIIQDKRNILIDTNQTYKK